MKSVLAKSRTATLSTGIVRPSRSETSPRSFGARFRGGLTWHGSFFVDLLRSPSAVIAWCYEERELASLAAQALVAILVGGAVFGGTVGGFRGGQQIAYSALKLPLATLITLAVCGPAFYALAAAFGRRWTFRTVLSLALAAGARSSLLLLALAPPLWLAIDCGASYHATKLLASLCYGAAGLSALLFVLRGLGGEPGRAGAALGLVLVFCLVGGQAAWLLRPYLGEPSDPRPPFIVTGPENGGVAGALLRSCQGVAGLTVRPASRRGSPTY